MRPLGSIVAAFVLTLTLAAPALAAPGASDANAVHYYLSLGDSLAAGYQPTGDPAVMYRTDEGYADQLYEMARSHFVKLRHVKLGCPGETRLPSRRVGSALRLRVTARRPWTSCTPTASTSNS
jgi:hypothetical protein